MVYSDVKITKTLTKTLTLTKNTNADENTDADTDTAIFDFRESGREIRVLGIAEAQKKAFRGG